jgi:imidazolonepropionase-like amidohydrolase
VIRLLHALAIVGAQVYTGAGPPLDAATVVIEGERVARVGVGIAVPAGAEIIQAEGMVVTPGLVDPASRLGVVDVSLEPSSVEGTAGPDFDPIRAALRVADTFNPSSFLIPVALAGGVTSAVVLPVGGIVKGQSAWVDLTEVDPVRASPVALHVSLFAQGDKPGSRARAYLVLREAFEDARLFRSNRGPFIARRLRELSVSAADVDVLARALEGEFPVVFHVDRASDIQSALTLAREHRLDAVILGGAEAWKLADELARLGVSVVLDPLRNLPYHFSDLEGRADNAQLLQAAGVRVAFTLRRAPHLTHRLRHVAGNAVAEGYPREAAMAAITSIPAEIYGLRDAGRLQPGSIANLVVWNGDPFELDTWPLEVYVRGKRSELRSRQELLTERYLR